MQPLLPSPLSIFVSTGISIFLGAENGERVGLIVQYLCPGGTLVRWMSYTGPGNVKFDNAQDTNRPQLIVTYTVP